MVMMMDLALVQMKESKKVGELEMIMAALSVEKSDYKMAVY